MFCEKCGTYIDNDTDLLCPPCSKGSKRVIDPALNYCVLKRSVYTYFLLFVVGSIVFGALAGALYVVLNPSTVVDPNHLTDEYINFISAFSNFFTYLLMTVVVVLMLKSFIRKDAKAIKNDLPRTFLLGFGGWVLVLLAAIAAGYILEFFNIAQDSANQGEIVSLVKSEYGFLMVLVTIFGAPIVEELVFRKAIIDGLERSTRLNTVVIILISSFLFALIHIVAEVAYLFTPGYTIAEAIEGFAQILPYLMMGVALGFIYKKANNNIIVPMIAHFFQNAFSMLAVSGVIDLTAILTKLF
jgi:membrane protease YdiL (CAAX protease family)